MLVSVYNGMAASHGYKIMWILRRLYNHSRLSHTFITTLTIYFKCWLFTTNVVCQLVHFTTTSQNPGEPQLLSAHSEFLIYG